MEKKESIPKDSTLYKELEPDTRGTEDELTESEKETADEQEEEEDEVDDLYFESNYTRALDSVLKEARKRTYEFAPWIPIAAPTGFGKTAAITSWLKHNKLKNVTIDATWCSPQKFESEYLPCDDLGSEPGVMMLGAEDMMKMFTPVKEVVNVVFDSETIDDMEGSVIFIDNYSWASKENRDELFKLIAYHQVTDLRSDDPHKRKTVNPLMLIVAMDSWHIKDLSPEEKKLFGIEEEDI